MSKILNRAPLAAGLLFPLLLALGLQSTISKSPALFAAATTCNTTGALPPTCTSCDTTAYVDNSVISYAMKQHTCTQGGQCASWSVCENACDRKANCPGFMMRMVGNFAQYYECTAYDGSPTYIIGQYVYVKNVDVQCDPMQCNNATHCTGHASNVTGLVPQGCTCTCLPGYKGANCSECETGYSLHTTTSDCHLTPCTVAGTCNNNAESVSGTDEVSGCTCTCKTGFTGDTCEKCDADYTGFPNCVPKTLCDGVKNCNGNGDAKGFVEDGCVCTCKDGFTGDLCDKCSSDRMSNYPICSVVTDAPSTAAPPTNAPSTATPSSTVAPSTTNAPSTSGPSTRTPQQGQDQQQQQPSTTTAKKPTTAGSQLLPCPFDMTSFPLSEGERHRFESPRFTGANASLVSCSFKFTCPSASSGMAIRITKNVSEEGSQLSVSASVPTATGATSFVSAATGLLAVFAAPEVSVTAFGNGGSFALVASCLGNNAKVPQNAGDVQYIEGPASASVNIAALRKEDARSFTISGSQEQNRAFLLSCANGDLTSANPIVQLGAIAGNFTEDTDALTVTALDSDTSETFSNASSVNRNFDATTDVSTFAASSQYYITWSSAAGSSIQSNPLTITYTCVESAWFTSGVGSQISSGSASVSSMMSAAIAAVLMALAA